jgi:hypothetical protein
MSTFSAETYQNEYLPIGGNEVNAVVTVTSTGGGGTAVAGAAVVIIVDTSGSMHYPRSKLRAAEEATRVAIDCIRDGVLFAVVAGTDRATALYPTAGVLAEASDSTRKDARLAVSKLRASGGTAIGRWLTMAGELLAGHPDRIRHAIMLTDGADESETPAELELRLAECVGLFQCDCRGVGTDWEVGELRKIASALLGSVDIIARPEDLAADFQAMMESAMGKETGGVSLRLWTPRGAEIAFVKQVAPTIEDLTLRAAECGPQTLEYPTGAWGGESRDYHVCVRVPTREVGDEMLAGRISLVVGDEVVSQSLVKAVWTDDERLSTRINREVAHYTGQAELADAIQEGLDARRGGDEHTATLKLGRAVKLAAAAGNDATMQLLQRIVEVDDAATGTVRLRRDVADEDEMTLDTRSTRTVRAKEAAS